MKFSKSSGKRPSSPDVCGKLTDFAALRRNRLLGTPNEETWPGVSQLPDYKPTFPQWAPVDLARAVPALDAHGIDLLRVRVRASLDAEKKADPVATLHYSKP